MPGITKTIALDDDQHTISDTALGLVDLDFTQDQVDATNRVVISVRSGSINLRYTGNAPTVAIGHNFTIGDTFAIEGQNDIARLELIRNGSTDAVVFVTLET